ncbi:hypothetical protein OAS19_06325 [Altererythrobacter sp.]|nr:hypothetical protein [Altererythrobacter sp.]
MFKFQSALNVLLACCLAIIPTHAGAMQNEDRTSARAFYFSAESWMFEKDYAKAQGQLDVAVRKLGGTNAKLAELQARIYFAQNRFDDATAAIATFYEFPADAALQKDVARLALRMDGLIKKRRADALTAEKERLRANFAAEAKRKQDRIDAKNRTGRLQNALASCVDSATCKVSRGLLLREIGDDIEPYLEGVEYRLCTDYSDLRSCDSRVNVASKLKRFDSSKIAMFEKACTVGSGEACRTMGSLYLPLSSGAPRPNGLTSNAAKSMRFFDRACNLQNYMGCNMSAALRYQDHYGVPKDRGTYKDFARKACPLSVREKMYYDPLMKQRCQKWGYPSLRVQNQVN